jgi:Fur family peroxide stress response transcriptional regulator
MKPDTHDFAERLERFKTACRDAGVKVTHQRIEIFREIATSMEHPDAEAVFRGVQVRVPSVSLDTVYRTLWLLTDLGLVSTLGPRRESVRFDGNVSPHHHYVCTRCGLTRDFESDELDSLALPRGLQGFGSVSTTRVEVRGMCAACTEATKRPSSRPQARR